MSRATKLAATVAVIAFGAWGLAVICGGCQSGGVRDLVDKYTGEGKPDTTWREGHYAVPIDGRPSEWTFSVRFRNPDMTRPNGKPERIDVQFQLEGIDYKVYSMIGNRDGLRHRGKGTVNWHVSGSIYAPIPKGESVWTWDCANGVLMMSIDGNPCNEYPLSVGDAKLKSITISPDAGRPCGKQWSDAVLTVDSGAI